MTTPASTSPGRRRRALLLACAEFIDPGLPALRSPRRDAEALAEVLADTTGPRYDVTAEINCTSRQAQVAIERFFSHARPDDLHLIYFSCHGIQDPHGDLFFAFSDTNRELPGSTAVSAEWVRARIQASRSRATVVLVDCCFSGAFMRGMSPRSGGEANVQALVRDLPEGSGVAVLTASGENEFSLEDEGDRAAAAAKPSYFTEAVITGIATGAADRSASGRITVDDLYDYVYHRIVSGPSPQRPRKMGHGEGQVVIADVGRRRPEPPLPSAPAAIDLTTRLYDVRMLTPWPPLPPIPVPTAMQPTDAPATGQQTAEQATRVIGVAQVKPPLRPAVGGQTAPVERHRRRRLIAIAAGAAAVALGAVLAAVSLSPGAAQPPRHARLVGVPYLVGLRDLQASTRIRSLGLTPSAASTQGAGCTLGTVVQQQPTFGESVAAGSVLTYTVCGISSSQSSAGKVPVPDVVGDNRTEAVAALTTSGLKFQVSFTDSGKPSDQVVRTIPAPGSNVAAGSTIKIYLSRHNLFTLPDVENYTADGALNFLHNQKFSNIDVVPVSNTTVPSGIVIDQHPAPGSHIRHDARVTLDVATPQPTTPPSSPPPSQGA
jgi:beta-lactam-binding protein with PASTA domain